MVEYFPHNYHSRHDPKLQRVMRYHGLEGVGLYWCLVEYLYEQGGKIPKDHIEDIAFELKVECERIANALRTYGLFYETENEYGSKHADTCIELRKNKSIKATQSADKRWGYANAMRTQCDGNANAMRTQCDGNAIKVKKRKENIYMSEFETFWFSLHWRV